MAPQFGQQLPVRVKNHYCTVLCAIVQKHNIERPRRHPHHIIPGDASFRQVVQYTHDWYCVPRGNERPHYRYDRYYEVLEPVKSYGGRKAHIDIGCGSGLFSWAFLDWARANGLAYDRVDLYGLDHSSEMINLAYAVRDGLAEHITDYPQLHYTHEADVLLQRLTDGHHAGTEYIVTFGHVLVQAHDPDAIQAFTQVIVRILELMDGEGECDLKAVDAHGSYDEFETGWKALLSRLEQAGVNHRLLEAPRGARVARLFQAGS